MKTFSLSAHSKLFSVPYSKKDYLFVKSTKQLYHEEPYRAESYAIVYIKEGTVKLNAGLYLSVLQISDTLNFSDQSVFGKFFKANTGISPIDYRKQFD